METGTGLDGTGNMDVGGAETGDDQAGGPAQSSGDGSGNWWDQPVEQAQDDSGNWWDGLSGDE